MTAPPLPLTACQLGYDIHEPLIPFLLEKRSDGSYSTWIREQHSGCALVYA